MTCRAAGLALLLALPAAAGTACGAPAQDLDTAVEALLPALEERSGLAALEPIRVATRDRASLEAHIIRRFDEELPAGELEGLEATYRLLGLLPDTLDLRALLIALYTEQVLGYYDPAAGTLFVMEGVEADALETVLVHELVHALQDQHADLDSLLSRERGNDRVLAAQAAIEGHATAVMLELQMERQLGQHVDLTGLPDLRPLLSPMLAGREGDFPVFHGAPRLVREALLFPYLEGAALVQALWRERPERPPPFGEWLPLSTAQVMDPGARYLDGPEPPLELELDDAGWPAVYENTLGAFETSVLLAEHLGGESRRGVDGWAGDRYRLAAAPEGGRALLWFSAWRDAAAADRFAADARRVLETLPDAGRAERVELDGRPGVLVRIAGPGVDPDAVPVPPVAVREGDLR